MRRLTRATTVVIVLALGCAPFAARALVSGFKASPTKPYVDQSVTISWRTDRNLKPGQRYQGTLTDEPLGNCAQLVFHVFTARPRKGHIMRMTFSPYEDKIWGGPLWCDGKAEVSVDVVTAGSKRTSFVGVTSFRFRRQP